MTSPRTRDEESLGTALWLLVAQAGHHRCAGWTYEERDAVLRCACGVPLYELRTIGRADPLAEPRRDTVGGESADDAG
jgi:hypothetical protein